MPGAPVHRVGDSRFCGAQTVGTGLQTKVFVEGLLAAVAGDVDSHSMLGQLIPTVMNVTAGNIPMIGALRDLAAGDMINPLIPHVTGFPTPASGSGKVFVGQGSFGGGMGIFSSLTGGLNVGEMVSMGGNIIGQVNNFVNVGGAGIGLSSGLLTLSNLTGTAPTAGQTVTGQSSGHSFTFSSFVDGRPPQG